MISKRISNAIDVFLKALENGTLVKGDCAMCAVGNLVAAGKGGEYFYDKNKNIKCTVDNTGWSKLFMTGDSGQTYWKEYEDCYSVIEDIEATDFNVEELMAIEYAFETNTEIDHIEYKWKTKEEIQADQVKGLEAVVEVMMGFDDVKESVEEVFTSKLCLQ
jgi:hypothetical protein